MVKTIEIERLGKVLRKLTDGEVGPSELNELSDLLERSEACRKYYLEYLELEAMLDELKGQSLPLSASEIRQLGASCGSASEPRQQDKAGQSSAWPKTLDLPFPINPTQILLFLVLALLVANLVWLIRSAAPTPVAHSQPDSVTRSAEDTSPQLVSMTACVWHSGKSPSLGTSFDSGELIELLEGIAELQVRNQDGESARVLIEGPARIFVRKDGHLGLQSGLLTASSDLHSGEFRIDVPNGTVVFSGKSAIGIQVHSFQSQVHVFEGEATLQQGLEFGLGEKEIGIAAGEAASFGKGANSQFHVSRTRADRNLFASGRTMSLDQLNLSSAYRDEILKSAPAIYWRFEEEGIVTNEVSEHFGATMRGDVRWKRFGENAFPEFGLSVKGDVFVMSEPWPKEPLDEYTVELWVKPSHYHNGTIIGMSEPVTTKHAFMLEIGAPYHKSESQTKPNRFRFLHRSPADYSGGSSSYDTQAYQVRTWQHMVARKTGNRLQLLIDGKIVGETIDDNPLPAGLQIVLGQLFPNRIKRSFIGQMDEVALYDRALTDLEITQHIQAARNKHQDAERESTRGL